MRPFEDDGPPTPRMWAACLAVALVVILLIALAFAWSIQQAAESAPPATTTTTTTTTLATVINITEPVVATRPAVRVSLPPTTTPFDCASYVNALSYEWMNLAPVHDAYRVTAQCLGWPLETIDTWEDFIVEDVIRNESGGCWNLRRGAVVSIWAGCVVSPQGTKEDSGFGQLIGLWWRGPGTVVCDRLGLCSSNDIIASPWNSMRALLVAVEHDGKRPWCYDAGARRLHPGCSIVSRNWP